MKFYWKMCFFFSSRRRHTRSLCDWSSDVCSSDLAKERAKGEKGEQARRANRFHERGACESPDHEAHQVKLQVSCRRPRPEKRFGMHHKPDDEASNPNLRAHVKKLRDDAAHQMLVRENPPPARGSPAFLGRCLLADFRQVGEVNQGGDQEENAADHQRSEERRVGKECRSGGTT